MIPYGSPICLTNLIQNNFEVSKMIKLKFTTLIFTGFLTAFTFLSVEAQDEIPPNDAPVQNLNQQRRPNLLAELNLTPEQIQQIRRVNAEKKPSMQAAQQKMREANRNLDQAIYADNADEAVIQTRLKDVQLAQAEIFKIRSMTEYAVRKILTPEQLVKFRELRSRFAERLENRPNKRRNRPMNAPNQRLLNRQRNMRPNNYTLYC